ncbi:ACB domain-containing protein [Trichophyton interdigitale]|uniref:ACB domain-containing protein n=3 Tax=Trichophyton TaxID=5550 RepID=A0A9P4YGW6_9EURO|nr:acyl CoA binding protein [Trichophyton equinum CBS 127.97]EZF31460.1 hypothetical protein H101_04928 [Trichophyton interdigitale H6]KAF3892639.1 ACB domain-containing protein [Trichophyton interdigitale]KDB27738.1 hypothetical protein H109_00501 [Trichophyton interdigitale MR816]KAF3893967.1 ACB domain-containing protein [Trichophyton interdigitale]
MSDSVDRVFVHALNTVKKIPRTGSARPPTADRLKLYGLYKQSMEGDVEGVMDRPVGDADVQAEKEKWDSWYAQRNLSRTEAKRRYITTLIETMHRYASPTPEAQELISELEFVWDQIKSNTSSSFSNPDQGLSVSGPTRVPSQTSYDNIGSRMARQGFDEAGRGSQLRVLSPVSQPDGGSRRHRYGSQSEKEHDHSPRNRDGDDTEDGEEEDQDEDEEEEFQEARNSFYENQESGEDPRLQPPTTAGQRHYQRWQKRVEQALTKMTVEVAAVREQLEARKAFKSRKSGIWSWIKWFAWVAIRQLFWDLALLAILLLYVRIRDERRLGRTLKSVWLEVRQRLSRVRIFRRRPS